MELLNKIGYEVSGIVVAIGAKVTRVALGDKVIAGTFNFGNFHFNFLTVRWICAVC